MLPGWIFDTSYLQSISLELRVKKSAEIVKLEIAAYCITTFDDL